MDTAQSGLPAELVLPMSHRGALNGFVLVGARRNGEPFRPDELDVLGFAAHQVGLDLHALRVELLEGRVRELAQQVDKQDSELALMAGRRRTPAGSVCSWNDGMPYNRRT
ncbi:MAG: GAF domain-containing protein [Pseudomonadota bacterium]